MVSELHLSEGATKKKKRKKKEHRIGMWDKEKLINLNPKISLIRLNVNGPVNQLKDTSCLTGFFKM